MADTKISALTDDSPGFANSKDKDAARRVGGTLFSARGRKLKESPDLAPGRCPRPHAARPTRKLFPSRRERRPEAPGPVSREEGTSPMTKLVGPSRRPRPWDSAKILSGESHVHTNTQASPVRRVDVVSRALRVAGRWRATVQAVV